jgi:hypothetical protein
MTAAQWAVYFGFVGFSTRERTRQTYCGAKGGASRY